MYVFTKPSAQADDTRSIFKTEFNRFEFSFPSPSGYHTKAKEPSLPLLFTYRGGNSWIHTFPKGFSAV